MNDLNDIIGNIQNLIYFVTGIGAVLLLGYIGFIALQFIRSILRTSNKITIWDIILIVLLVTMIPQITYTLVVDLMESISSAFTDSYPYVIETQEVISNMILESLSLEVTVEPVPLPIPTEVPQPTVIVIEPTATSTPIPTIVPTMDVNNYNILTPPPTPEIK